MSKPIPPEDWEWFGNHGHFICGRWCRYHLCTKVGDWLVSTVGEYVHPRHGMGGEQAEAAWLEKNWPGEDIGFGRKYETMVFRTSENSCECGCGLPKPADWCEVEAKGANTAGEARTNHMALCVEYALKETPDE
jgi:hypothetical protein